MQPLLQPMCSTFAPACRRKSPLATSCTPADAQHACSTHQRHAYVYTRFTAVAILTTSSHHIHVQKFSSHRVCCTGISSTTSDQDTTPDSCTQLARPCAFATQSTIALRTRMASPPRYCTEAWKTLHSRELHISHHPSPLIDVSAAQLVCGQLCDGHERGPCVPVFHKRPRDECRVHLHACAAAGAHH